MSVTSSAAQNFNWLINDFAHEVAGVLHVVVVSTDGLLLAASQQLSEEQSEQFAAMASGLVSLAEGSARLFERGRCEQTIIRMERGYLFVMSISDGSRLAVVADERCDMKVTAYKMALLVDNAGHVLTPQLRGELREVLTR